MCLISQKIKPTIAEQNIVCYKVVSEERRLYYTPVIHMAILKSNRTIKPELFTLNYDLKKISGGYSIGPGFIHAYRDVESAYRVFSGISHKAILECIIPVGASFYVGDNNDICATELKIIRKV